MSRTQNARDSCSPPPFARRALFVLALRRRCPQFWKSLNRAWRSDGDWRTVLAEWMKKKGVVDPWLTDFVLATLNLWGRDPDGPNATLREGHMWFALPAAYRDSGAPDFQPVFDDPYPTYTSFDDTYERYSGANFSEAAAICAELTVESVDEFKKRMRRQFEARLTDYGKSIRHLDGYRGTATTVQHADWTALAFGGLTFVEIARRDLDTAPHLAPEDAVRMAVNRFATEIGLTLPKRSSNG